MRKSVSAILIPIFLALAAFMYWANFVYINHAFYTTTTEKLDLSGQILDHPRRIARLSYLKEADLRGTRLSTADYQYLTSALPNCIILWDPACDGGFYTVDADCVRLTTLTTDDLFALDFLPNLQRVDAVGCRDYDLLMELARTHPDTDIDYSVSLSGVDCNVHDTSVSVADANATELMAMLPYLPRVERLHLTGHLPDAQALIQLQQAFPAIVFSCEISGQTLVLGRNTNRLELSGIPLATDDVRYLLACCPKLEEAEILECGLTEEEIITLTAEFPDCFFIRELTLAGTTLLTDVREIDFSGRKDLDIQAIEDALPYCRRLEKVIMCNCGISNEDMDALNRRHPDVKFVWNIKAGAITLRTDAKFFAPVISKNHVTNRDLKDLHYCTDIIAVDIGHMYVTDLSWAASMPDLQYLIIADTQISDISPLANAKKLVFLEMFLTPCRDYSPLLGCTALEDLNLCFTYGKSDDIRKMTWLKRLWWDGNWSAVRGLAEALPDTETNFHSGSSTGGTWRDGAHYKEQRDILGMPYFYG